MIGAWMLYSIAVGVLIGVAALAGDHCLRLVRLPVRWVWLGGMLATVVLSGHALFRVTTLERTPDARAGVQGHLVESSSSLPTAGYVMRIAGAITGAARDVRAAAAATAERAYRTAANNDAAGRALVAAWALASVTLLLVLAGTLNRLRRARRSWRSDRIADLHVLISRDAGPALVGLVRPSIVVPSWLLSEPLEHQQLVVQHEDEHRRAGDHALLAAACLTVCMMPWNIALLWMLIRTRLAVELDCDARVLRRGVKARSYGTLLLDIAGRTRLRAFGAPALADSRTHLERRLIAMTEPMGSPRRARIAAAGFTAFLLAAAACTADLPTSAAIDEMDVTEVELQAKQVGVLVRVDEEGSPLYVVDGVIVDRQAARELDPEQIRRIEVVKAQAALREYGERGEHGVVRVETSGIKQRVLGTPLDQPQGNVILRRESVDKRATTLRATRMKVSEVSGPDSPLYVVDGVVATGSFSIRNLAPESIDRIEVVKGEAARGLYDDPRAANGVIRIWMKPGAR